MSTWYNYNTRKIDYPKPYSLYESKVVTISGGSSDYDLKTEESLFSNVYFCSDLTMIVGSGDVSVKLNDTSNDAITITANSTFNLSNFQVDDLYVTAAGDTSINILMLGYR